VRHWLTEGGNCSVVQSLWHVGHCLILGNRYGPGVFSRASVRIDNEPVAGLFFEAVHKNSLASCQRYRHSVDSRALTCPFKQSNLSAWSLLS